MANKLIITETELRKINKEEIEKQLNNTMSYRMEDTEEIYEYMWLKPNLTNVGVDIFVDDGGAYLRHNHELLLFARNGYGRGTADFIPFSISNKPKVLDDDMDFNISYDVIFSIQDFIQANLYSLKSLADERVSQEMFVQSINKVKTNLRFVGESKTIISEMATLRTTDSQLPVDIWIDEGSTFQGYAPRFKFRASNEQRTTREFSSMLITPEANIENMPENSPLRKKDIYKLKRFVINNMENLLKLANGEIYYLKEFKPNMILES